MQAVLWFVTKVADVTMALVIAFILVVYFGTTGCAPAASSCAGKSLRWKVFVGCPLTHLESAEWSRRVERNARQDREWQERKATWAIERGAR